MGTEEKLRENGWSWVHTCQWMSFGEGGEPSCKYADYRGLRNARFEIGQHFAGQDFAIPQSSELMVAYNRSPGSACSPSTCPRWTARFRDRLSRM